MDHIGFICSFLHRAFSNAFSNCLHEKTQSHIGCICLASLHCGFVKRKFPFIRGSWCRDPQLMMRSNCQGGHFVLMCCLAWSPWHVWSEAAGAGDGPRHKTNSGITALQPLQLYRSILYRDTSIALFLSWLHSLPAGPSCVITNN